jgi:alpha-L-fucosidase
MTIQKGSWSNDRSEPLAEYFTAPELVQELVQTTAWNGTLIMNIGPTADGRITPIFEERLAQMGAWLKINGESIFASRPWRLSTGMEKDGSAYYTQSKDGSTVYAIMPSYPTDMTVTLKEPKITANTTATLLDGNVKLTFSSGADGLTIKLPTQPIGSSCAWVIRLTGVQ